ncbi:MAG TPA: DUF4398 domain-containing protein [Myxococcota bacterium]|nr:DUF4398 domain-containing protein [Myxococcota bacterium]HRY94310.1 DUF4398 domain-containing protein [Myxococcota bacterium]HSA24761.1 DUF4398 domain-containing protein [Myxococcota bacterium]
MTRSLRVSCFGIALLVGAALLLGGCGPSWSTHLILAADTSQHNAKMVGAEDKAPYEYTASREYLHQARVKWGTSDFEYAVDYAKKAKELAELGREKAMKKDEE